MNSLTLQPYRPTRISYHAIYLLCIRCTDFMGSCCCPPPALSSECHITLTQETDSSTLTPQTSLFRQWSRRRGFVVAGRWSQLLSFGFDRNQCPFMKPFDPPYAYIWQYKYNQFRLGYVIVILPSILLGKELEFSTPCF